jgi:hypothetical protein
MPSGTVDRRYSYCGVVDCASCREVLLFVFPEFASVSTSLKKKKKTQGDYTPSEVNLFLFDGLSSGKLPVYVWF